MYALITLPEPTSILSNSAPWFNAWFAEYLPYLYIGAGVILAFVMVRWLVNVFIFGFRDGISDIHFRVGKTKEEKNGWTHQNKAGHSIIRKVGTNAWAKGYMEQISRD